MQDELVQSKWYLDIRHAPTVNNTKFHRKVSHLQLGCQLAFQRLCISTVSYKVWRCKVHAAVVCRLHSDGQTANRTWPHERSCWFAHCAACRSDASDRQG